jgi:amino acid transporter
VFALVACLFCAWSIGLLAREMPTAGSLATYAARGIHPSVGFLIAWAYVLVGWLIPPLVLLQLGFTVDGTLHSEFSGYTANLWWIWSILGAIIILAAGYYGIRTSARLGTILGIFEIGVFLVLITPLTTPYSYMGPAVAVWMVIGLIYLIFLYSRHKQRVTEVGLVHLDLEENGE